MTSQRVSRGAHVAEASRILPIKRGEKFCSGDHSTLRGPAACPKCGASK